MYRAEVKVRTEDPGDERLRQFLRKALGLSEVVSEGQTIVVKGKPWWGDEVDDFPKTVVNVANLLPRLSDSSLIPQAEVVALYLYDGYEPNPGYLLQINSPQEVKKAPLLLREKWLERFFLELYVQAGHRRVNAGIKELQKAFPGAEVANWGGPRQISVKQKVYGIHQLVKGTARVSEYTISCRARASRRSPIEVFDGYYIYSDYVPRQSRVLLGCERYEAIVEAETRLLRVLTGSFVESWREQLGKPEPEVRYIISH